jgi:hypothetical protein
MFVTNVPGLKAEKDARDILKIQAAAAKREEFLNFRRLQECKRQEWLAANVNGDGIVRASVNASTAGVHARHAAEFARTRGDPRFLPSSESIEVIVGNDEADEGEISADDQTQADRTESETEASDEERTTRSQSPDYSISS